MDSDFYQDRKYCPQCTDYVSYLQSMEHAYCVNCGGQVRLFSEDDWNSFHTALKELEGIESQSVGEGRLKRVKIYPA